MEETCRDVDKGTDCAAWGDCEYKRSLFKGLMFEGGGGLPLTGHPPLLLLLLLLLVLGSVGLPRLNHPPRPEKKPALLLGVGVAELCNASACVCVW
jgi:hypothetical protein